MTRAFIVGIGESRVGKVPDRDRNLSFAYCTNFQREGPGIGPRGAALAVAAGGGERPDWLK